jgi:hypothetical protein
MPTLDMTVREPFRWAVAASLLYAAYVVVKCPCSVLASCQQAHFYAATLLPVVAVAVINANEIT